MLFQSRVVTESLDVPPGVVYQFVRTMKNLPQWASGLASGIRQEDGVWVTDSPMGRVQVAMAPRNNSGVLDHDVTLPNGVIVHNAFRVTPAGDGSTLSFVVLQLPDVTAEAFEKDVEQVASDLGALKRLLEEALKNASTRGITDGQGCDMAALELAMACLKAYVEKDREAIEALISEDFRFTSPLDNALDRETYLSRCWPNSVSMTSVAIEQAVDLGERAFVVYEAEARGKRFRNCELHTARDGRLVSVEVYFGWDMPHPAARGSYLDKQDSGT